MNETDRIPKARRNLRALFVLGFALTILPSISGGVLCYLGYTRSPGAEFPLWKAGQMVMLFGLTNLFVYTLLLGQVRRLVSFINGNSA